MGRGLLAGLAVLGLAAAGWFAWHQAGVEDGAARPGVSPTNDRVPAKPGAVDPNLPVAPPAPAGDGGADGYLLRSRTGALIPGTVTATTRGGLVVTARAGADGVFRLRGLPRGETVGIEFSSPGLLMLRMPRVRIPREEFLDLGYVTLGEGQILEVLAVDGTGRPVEGCAVAVAMATYQSPLERVEEPGVPEVSAVTDGAGRAAFPPIPPGSWSVEARAPGFARAVLSVDLVEGALRDPVRVVLAPGFVLEGRVLHADGKPAAGVKVLADPTPGNGYYSRPAVAVADAEGRFRVEGLPRGRVALSVIAVPGILETAPPVEIPAAGPVEIRLFPRTEVAGRVVDDEAGTPIPGAEVAIDLAEAQTRSRTASARTSTGPDGAFRFAGIPALPVESISAAKEGYYRAREPVPPAEGQAWEIRLRKGAVVRGVVREGSGAPVSLAWIRLSAWRGRDGIQYLDDVRSDEAGRYEIRGVPPGRALLEGGARNRHIPGVPEDSWEALKNGEIPENCGVDVPAEGAVEKDLLLVPDSRVEGRVLHADGTPAPGYLVALASASSPRDGRTGSTASAADGSFAIEDLTPETAMVAVALGPGGVLGASAPFDLVESEVVRGVTVTLATPGSLRGRVLREDGRPAPGATLFLVPKRYDPQRDWEWRNNRNEGTRVPVADDGTFAVENLAPGPWTPIASAPDCLETRAAAVDLAGGEKREGVEILLAPGFVLEGRVLDPSGGPVAGAAVSAVPKRETEDQEQFPGTVTDALGQFRIGDRPAGTWEVRANREGFVPAVAEVETGGAPLVLTLGEGLSIQGRAVEQGTGKPAAGVTLVVVGRSVPDEDVPPTPGPSTVTVAMALPVAADGTFERRGLSPGDYELQFQSESGAFVPRTVRGVAAGTKGLVVELARGLAIAGRVEDAGGLPLALGGLTVELQRAEPGGWSSSVREEEVGSGGAFALGGLAPGRYRLTFGTRTWGGEKGVYAARSVEAEAGAADLVVPLSRGKMIAGRVLLADGTAPTEENFWITLHPSRGGETPRAQESIFVDEKMFFHTDPLAEGVPFDLEVRSFEEKGNVAAARDVLPGTTGVVLRLEKGGTIRGRVLDPEGNPAGGVEVYALPSRGGVPPQRVNGEGDGSFTIEGLAPGNYRLFARSEERNLAPVEAEGGVAAGAEGVTVRTAKGLEFRARCVGADGQHAPMVTALVEEFLDGRWEGPFVMPVNDGVLVVRGLPKCRVRVSLYRTPGALEDRDPDPPAGPFEVPGEEAVLTLPK